MCLPLHSPTCTTTLLLTLLYGVCAQVGTSSRNVRGCYNSAASDKSQLAAELQLYRWDDRFDAASNTVALCSTHEQTRAFHLARFVREEEGSTKLYALFKPPLDHVFNGKDGCALDPIELSSTFVRLPASLDPPRASLSVTHDGQQRLTGGRAKSDMLISACKGFGLDNAELVFVNSKVPSKVVPEVGEFAYSPEHGSLVKVMAVTPNGSRAGVRVGSRLSQSTTRCAYFKFIGAPAAQIIELQMQDLVFPVDIRFHGAGNKVPECSFELRASEGTDTL